MKKIKSITVEKVKGIDSKTFVLELIPNKPSILVAPNGYGKSSFTAAFSKLNGNGIKLDKDTFHKNDETNKPKLFITIVKEDSSEVIVFAEENANNIKTEFDIFVINNLLIPKHKKNTFNGHTVVSSSIEVAPIILVDKVPTKVKIEYSSTSSKTSFGINGKILPNISEVLSHQYFISDLISTVDFAKFDGVKISGAIKTFIDGANLLSGNTDGIISSINTTLLEELKEKGNLIEIVAILNKYFLSKYSETESFLIATEIVALYKRDGKKFYDTGKYNDYLCEKDAYDKLFLSFNTTWKNICPKEDDGSLVVKFPKANQISNGERDVITFLSSLIRCRRKWRLTKKSAILIIDEVFDYLDDANLIMAQYYITQMINDFKRSGKKLFPLIMTHLNPYYFKNFVFKDQHIYYLNKITAHINREIEKVIFSRENATVKGNLDCYFLHHNTSNINIEADFVALGLDRALGESSNFKVALNSEITKYLDGKTTYDPLSVCLAVRLQVEVKAFSTLGTDDDRTEFIGTKKTVNKLDFAGKKGIDVPDIYYLLGIIYNDIAHIRPNTDYSTPIISKLNNLTIRKMITKLFS
jgi:hypothetical protein